jgi:UV DNA damage endonuclease
MDGMGLGPECVVILHVGGVAGGVDAGAGPLRARVLHAQRRGPGTARRRERRPHVRAVRRPALSERIGRPVVWDILHHHCNDPERIPDREALERPWPRGRPGVTPKIHYSTPKTAVEEKKRKVGRRVERSLVLPQLRATPT